MSTAIHTVFLIATAIITNPFTDTFASKIYSLDVPYIVRNGTGPIDLSCIYDIGVKENGLIIKWYHNTDQIYQWIPPMPPEDVGVINGLAEYPEQNLGHPALRSIIHLKMVTVEMSGFYTCIISTFQEEDFRWTKMVVYVPETSVSIRISSFNETHLGIMCVANGAQPRPMLKLYIEGIEVDSYVDATETVETYENNLFMKRSAIVRNGLEPMLLECEISIPHTDYKRRERIVHYPTQTLAQRSSASRYWLTAINIIFFCTVILLR